MSAEPALDTHLDGLADDDLEWGPGLGDDELADLLDAHHAEIRSMAADDLVTTPGEVATLPSRPAWADPAAVAAARLAAAWIPGATPGVARYLVAGELVAVPERAVVDVSAAPALAEMIVRRKAAQTGPRQIPVMPEPEMPAEPVTDLATLPQSARQLATAATAAGWTVAATRSRGPWPAERSLCPRCSTWVGVTKAGALRVHGPRADRCQQTVVDPDAPSFQVVDSVVVRAVAPAGHRIGAMWVGVDGTFKVGPSELFLRGYRPRAVGVDDLKAILKVLAAGPSVEQCTTVERAAPYTEGA